MLKTAWRRREPGTLLWQVAGADADALATGLGLLRAVLRSQQGRLGGVRAKPRARAL